MKPIIFNTGMARAVLCGSKTQTRRAMNPQPILERDGFWNWKNRAMRLDSDRAGCPEEIAMNLAPYKPGDVLWVRETWCEPPYETECVPLDGGGHVCMQKIAYRADGESNYRGIWRPPAAMPRRAARLFLRVTGARAERLQDIDRAGCVAEGVCMKEETDERGARNIFKGVWDEANAKRGLGWDANPWVWAIEFERTETE